MLTQNNEDLAEIYGPNANTVKIVNLKKFLLAIEGISYDQLFK